MADYTICDDWGEGSGLELHEKNCNEDQIGKKITFIKLITTVPYLYFILSIKTCSETQSVVNLIPNTILKPFILCEAWLLSLSYHSKSKINQ